MNEYDWIFNQKDRLIVGNSKGFMIVDTVSDKLYKNTNGFYTGFSVHPDCCGNGYSLSFYGFGIFKSSQSKISMLTMGRLLAEVPIKRSLKELFINGQIMTEFGKPKLIAADLIYSKWEKVLNLYKRKGR